MIRVSKTYSEQREPLKAVCHQAAGL